MAGITIRDDPLGKGPVLPLWAIGHCGVKSMSVGSRWVVASWASHLISPSFSFLRNGDSNSPTSGFKYEK